MSTGVEKDAIEEDKAFSHVAKIWLSWDAIVDSLPFEHTIRFQDMNILVKANFADFPLNI